MGKQQFEIETVLFKRPSIYHYMTLTPEVKSLVDYTIKENLNPNPVLVQKVFFIKKTIKPKTQNLWTLSWSDIIELKKSIQEKDILSFLKIMYKVDEKQFMMLDTFNCFAAYKWFVDRMEEIYNAELERLHEEPEDDFEGTGVEELSEYDYVPALDYLAKGDLTKYDEYLKMPYAKVFRKMAMDKVIREINKKYQKNVSRRTQKHSSKF